MFWISNDQIPPFSMAADWYVAWRGDRPLADPLALIDHIRGAAN
jgi:hypothetical protein